MRGVAKLLLSELWKVFFILSLLFFPPADLSFFHLYLYR